ncbi:MAG: amidase [Alphaproteobacteria bacterium]|nr:amidase [Alphaproteobacteria bacterium]
MMDATALSDAIRAKRVSCVEVMQATLARIARLNPKVNAIIDLRDRDDLMAEARARDDDIGRGHWRGVLHGFPQAIKNLEPVAGVRMTMGSPLLKDFMPPADSIMVERMRNAGAIIIGRTNTPAFGLGSHTYNPVHGTTLNAYDQRVSAGGSSGGAAVAVALRMLPVADGGDYGGSLRNPAGWNNIFALRPSVGRVPSSPRDVWMPGMSVLGPMARNVGDLALLLGVQAGFDARAPTSLDGRLDLTPAALDADMKSKRIAWLGDFGGQIPFESGVLELCRTALNTFETLGCIVEEAVPDYPLDKVWRAFLDLRAWHGGSPLLALYEDPKRRALLNPQAIYEIEAGQKLTAYDLSAASMIRTHWYEAVRKLFERYDYLVTPTAQLFPFDAAWDWPKEIAGRPMASYHEWMQVAIAITMTACPVAAVPAGFNAAGLPMGLQLIGPVGGEVACLQLAQAYDKATRWTAKRLPGLLLVE